MKRFNFIPTIALLCIGMFSTVSADESIIMTINGEDAALPADTAIPSYSYGSTLKGVLLDSGISFILVSDNDSGIGDVVTVFASEDADVICSLDASLLKDVTVRLSGNVVTCS